MDNDTIALVLLIIGIILLVVELFIEGFGFIGILGIACSVAAIFIYADTLWEGIIMAGILVLILGVGFIILSQTLFKGNGKMVLTTREDPDKGYTAGILAEDLIGKVGIAETDLHPSGAAKIDGQKMDVVSQGDYIKKGTELLIIDVRANRILVKANNE